MTRRKDPAVTRTPSAEMAAAGHALPAFEPVPRKFRHDGWTPERQQAFIAALAESGNVTAACEQVGMTTVGAYYLRRQPGAESFAQAWEAALDGGTAPADQPPPPAPLTLRGLMHILEAQARRQREAREASGLTDDEIDDANAALIEGFVSGSDFEACGEVEDLTGRDEPLKRWNPEEDDWRGLDSVE